MKITKPMDIPTNLNINCLYIFSLLCAFGLPMSIQAQVYNENCPYIEWQQNYGGTEGDFAKTIRPTADGGYIMVGNSYSSNGDISSNTADNAGDVWIVKTDDLGEIVWEKKMGGSDNDFGNSIELTADGGYIVAGSARSNDGDVPNLNGGADIWLIKLSETGSIEWQHTYGGQGNELAPVVQQSTDGGYIVAATLFPEDASGALDSDYWLLKVSASGIEEWTQRYGTSVNEEAKDMVVMPDGGFVVTGWKDRTTMGENQNTDAWIVKTNATGDLLWDRTYGDELEDYANAISLSLDGGLIIAGQTEVPDAAIFQIDSWILKLTPFGNLKWELKHRSSQVSSLDDVKMAANGEIIAVGQTRSSTLTDFLILIVNEEGQLLWEKSLGGNLQERAFSVHPTEDGGHILVGHSYSNDGQISDNQGKADYLAIKLNQIKPIDLGVDTVTCDNVPLMLDAYQDNGTYRWQDGSTASTFEAPSTGEYFVEVEKETCRLSDTIDITIYDPEALNLGRDTLLCGDEKLLVVDLPYEAELLWQDGSRDSTFLVSEPGIYEVIARVDKCVFTDEIKIRYCERCFYLPNIFSPNFDGINDEMKPIVLCDIENYHFVVFNRWGQAVFESYTIGEAWDGQFKNKAQPNGVYAYILEYDIERLGIQLHEVVRGDVTISK